MHCMIQKICLCQGCTRKSLKFSLRTPWIFWIDVWYAMSFILSDKPLTCSAKMLKVQRSLEQMVRLDVSISKIPSGTWMNMWWFWESRSCSGGKSTGKCGLWLSFLNAEAVGSTFEGSILTLAGTIQIFQKLELTQILVFILAVGLRQ